MVGRWLHKADIDLNNVHSAFLSPFEVFRGNRRKGKLRRKAHPLLLQDRKSSLWSPLLEEETKVSCTAYCLFQYDYITFLATSQFNLRYGNVDFRVVPILIPVSENASNTAENAGIGISEYASLCTDPIPCCAATVNCYFCQRQRRTERFDSISKMSIFDKILHCTVLPTSHQPRWCVRN